MLYRLICVGRLRSGPARTLADEFFTRLRPFHMIEEIEVKAAPGDDPIRAVTADTETVLRKLEPGERVWLLDREGREFSSEELRYHKGMLILPLLHLLCPIMILA